MKPKEYAKEVIRWLVDLPYDPHKLSTIAFLLHSGIEVDDEDDTVYSVYERHATIDISLLKEWLCLDMPNKELEDFFNKVSKHFNRMMFEFLKDDNVEMFLAMKMVIYLREYNFNYTGTYKKAKEIIDIFDIFDNCDSAMLELTELAYKYSGNNPDIFLKDMAEYTKKYFKGYYDEF